MSDPIIVLGMHRSGTSMLAHCLINMGVSMGAELLESDSFNKYGYYEDLDFVSLNKHILASLGCDWMNPPSYMEVAATGKLFISELQRLDKEKNIHKLWGWKDPRNCLTLPLFKEVWPNAKYIRILRNRASIVKSLTRTRSDKRDWAELCNNYANNTLAGLIGIPSDNKLIVRYETLTSKKYVDNELKKIAGFIGVGLHDVRKAKKAIHFRD